MGAVLVKRATEATDIASVKELFTEYFQALNTDFGKAVGCANSQADMQNFPALYAGLFLGKLESIAVAACGLAHINNQDIELVRLYCRPQGRGHALGHKLSKLACDYAKRHGYKRLVLSTEPEMVHAVSLYKAMGFVDIANYADAPSQCSKYMALEI